MTYETVVCDRGMLVLPQEVMDKYGLHPGDRAFVHERADGRLELSFKDEVVEIDLSDATLFALMKQAHEQDITLNQLVNDILRKKMNEDHGTVSK